MKITSKQYALSLYKITKGLKKVELQDGVKKFFEFLIQNNDISKTKKIIIEFEKIWNNEEKIIEAKTVSSRKLDNNTLEILKNYISKKANAKKILLEQAEDKNILGGIIIKYGDKIIDGSLKTKLNTLKQIMKK